MIWPFNKRKPTVEKAHYKVNKHTPKEEWLKRHPPRIERLKSLLDQKMNKNKRNEIQDEIAARGAHLSELIGEP